MDRARRRKGSSLEEVARLDVTARGRRTRKVVSSLKAEQGLSDLEVGMWQKRPADLAKRGSRHWLISDLAENLIRPLTYVLALSA